MKTVTDKSFKKEVLDSKKPVLVDFFTTWCQPCKRLIPLLEEIKQNKPTIKFVKLDAEDNEIADDYKIDSVPTLIIFKDGNEVARKEGLLSKKSLISWIENYE